MSTNPSTFLSGPNAPFIEELYARYLDQPESVDPSWRKFCAELEDESATVLNDIRGASWAPRSRTVEIAREDANGHGNGHYDEAVAVRSARPQDLKRAARSLRQTLVLDLLQLERTAFNGLLPRPRRAMAGLNLRAHLLKNLSVVEQRKMSPEDRRLTLPRLLRHLLVNVRNLLVRGGDGPLERQFLGSGIPRLVLDHKMRHLKLIHGADGETGRC